MFDVPKLECVVHMSLIVENKKIKLRLSFELIVVFMFGYVLCLLYVCNRHMFVGYERSLSL